MATTAFPEQPFDGVQRVELHLVPLAVVRHEGVVLDDLPRLFDAGYAAIGALFGRDELTPAGPALAVYRGEVTGAFDLEVGYPVTQALTRALGESGEVVASVLPGGPAAAATHVGGYDGLGDAWAALAAASGGRPTGLSVEVYVSDPSSTPAEALRTDLLLLLDGGSPPGAQR